MKKNQAGRKINKQSKKFIRNKKKKMLLPVAVKKLKGERTPILKNIYEFLG